MPLPHRDALRGGGADPTAPPRVLKHVVQGALVKARMARCKGFLPDLHAKCIPAHARQGVRDLHPCIVEPNKCFEGTVGYSAQVCRASPFLAADAPNACGCIPMAYIA